MLIFLALIFVLFVYYTTKFALTIKIFDAKIQYIVSLSFFFLQNLSRIGNYIYVYVIFKMYLFVLAINESRF